MESKKIMVIFGTRPEAIKMAPLVKALGANDRFNIIVTVTAQHREMLDQVLNSFHIYPDYDLNVMEKRQTLTKITIRILNGLREILEKESPDMVLVHGDTSTTFAASLAAFYQKIPIGHIEAGLRTFNKYAPYPEEINRKLTGCLADLHFAPTQNAKDNLLKEGVAQEKIFVTGNTIIDALLQTLSKAFVFQNDALNKIDLTNKRSILLTSHRRENMGQPMKNIFLAVKEIAEANDDIVVIFPVHPNQKVREIANTALIKQKNIYIIEPLAYQEIVNLMSRNYLILTDSGGIQEEAAALGKPVLVLRNTTERAEALECGAAKIIGTEKNNIVNEIDMMLHDREKYEQMTNSPNPYGDGNASQKIVDILFDYFS